MALSSPVEASLLPRPRICRRRPGHLRLGREGSLPAGVLQIGRLRHPRGDQWFSLRIRPDNVQLLAGGDAGQRYALGALRQLCGSARRSIPALDLEDWPDFAARGVMLDISRDKVPTLATLRGLIDRLAAWRVNQLQLYTEHVFAYAGHERVWRGASPLTPAQVRRLDAYCRRRGIELVPNQNSFGHMERWLRHEPLSRLAETDGPWRTPWGTVRTKPGTLCPLDPGSIRLMAGLYAQLLPNFSSRLFNVGCDETFELGQGRSRQACGRRGAGSVYLDYLRKLYRLARRRGRRIMFWADILLDHPEMFRHAPKDGIALIWGYEADHAFEAQCATLAASGRAFYVCPGTSSWCSFAGRTTNALTNICRAAQAGLRHGAAGLLVTDWGDFGHRQHLPASFAPLLYAAAVGWCVAANREIDVSAEVSRRVFGDSTGRFGRLWCEAGDVHEAAGVRLKNRTILFEIMQTPLESIPRLPGLSSRAVGRMESQVDGLARRARALRAANQQARLARRELLATLAVMGHACRRANAARARRSSPAPWRRLAAEMGAILAEHRRLWLARNRPGGLASSLGYYRRNLWEYESAANSVSLRRNRAEEKPAGPPSPAEPRRRIARSPRVRRGPSA